MAFKPPRNQTASVKVSDANNVEAPSAAHQKILATKPTPDLIAKLRKLADQLPETVPEATDTDNEIHRVITQVHGLDDDSVQSTFVRRFDILFAEKSRNAEGRLIHVRRGELGMKFVIQYLDSIHWESDPDLCMLAIEWLQRLIAELEYLSQQNQRPAKKRKLDDKTADRIFEAVMNGKKKGKKNKSKKVANDESDPEYRPHRPRGTLSEDSEDDFDNDELDEAATLESSRKRKLLVVHSDEGSDNDNPLPKSTKSKGSAAPPPKASVIEISDESDDEPDKPSRRGPKNTTKDHFHPPIATMISREKRWEFRCKHCAKSLSVTRTVGRKDSFEDEEKLPHLGNLATHLQRTHDGPDIAIPGAEPDSDLHGISPASAKIMEDSPREGKLNPAVRPTQKGFYAVFAAWILEDDLPFTTGETGEIHRLFKYMQCKFLLPSDTTVRNQLAKMYSEMFRALKDDLKLVKSKIAITTDTWTTKSMMFTFAGTIGSWITEDWELFERVLDFHPIQDKEHEGVRAACALAGRLSQLQILEKLLSVTLDNVSVNDVLMVALGRLLAQKFDIQFVPDNSQIHCLTHVVNLVVQKMLAVLEEADDPDVVDYYLSNKDLPFHYDPDTDAELWDLEDEQFVYKDEEAEEAANTEAEAEVMEMMATEYENLSALHKLRLIVTKICSSPQRRRSFKIIAAKMYKDTKAPSGRKLSTLMLIRDVKHRWNFTEAMISCGKLLQKAIDKWVAKHDEFEALELSDAEWDLLMSLGALLKVFTEVTLQMSKAQTPTLPWVLPLYKQMSEHLEKTREDQTILEPLRVAAAAGLTKLAMYYAKASKCQFNVIATILHLSLGLSWFTAEDRPNARTLFTFVYNAYKKRYDQERTAAKNAAPAIPKPSRHSTGSLLDTICDFEEEDDEANAAPGLVGELEQFFAARRTFGRGDRERPLLWWKEFGFHFPVVSHIAQDFLAIPGASVSVERLFSKSRNLCRETRSSLKANTIMEAMLTKMWVKEGYFKY